MKKFYPLLLFTILTLCSPAQSIVVSTNLWSNVFSLEPSGNVMTEKIRFTSDTTINLLSYKKVERTIDSNQVLWYPYGFIRENSDKRVYYKQDASSPEVLLYALNLHLGDSIMVYGLNTLNFTVFMDSAMYHVTAIDSLLVGPTYRRQLHLSGNPGGTLVEAAQWVDSLGGMGGMLHNWNLKVGEDGYNLLCFEENGNLEYHNPYPFYTNCYVTIGIDTPKNNDVTLSVAPNPVQDVSTVSIRGMKGNPILQVRICNTLGEIVLMKNASAEFQLRSSELAPGIYYLTVQTAEGRTASQKFVVL